MNSEEYRKKKLKEQEEYWKEFEFMWLHQNGLLEGLNNAMGLSASASAGGGVILPEPRESSNKFIIEITTTSPNKSILMPLNGAGSVDADIDWGDGTVTHVTHYNDPEATHIYEEEGVYLVSVDGLMEVFDTAGFDTALSITKVISWGLTGLKVLALYGARNLTEIPTDIYGSFELITSFNQVFRDCYVLESIPLGLFDKCPLVTSFEFAFTACKTLTFLPDGIFANCPLVTNFGYVFESAETLASVPPDLFSNNLIVTSFSHSFTNCFELVSIPSNLFANNTGITTFNNIFSGCYALTAIPDGLFNSNVNATDFNSAFAWDTGITSIIPPTLFDNIISATPDLTKTFRNCSAMTGDAPDLWIDFPGATSSQCFVGCNFDNQAAIPAGWK